MGIRSRLLGVPGASRGGGATTGLSAAGSTQSDATAALDEVTVVSTVALGAGVRLRGDLEPGDSQVVANHGANGLSVYPPTGGTIGLLAVNDCAVLLPGATAVFYCASNAASGFTFVVK